MCLENFLLSVRQWFDLVPDNDSRAKVPAGSLVALLVFFFSRDRDKKSLETLRRLAEVQFGTTFSRGGFWERLATNKLKNTIETLACAMIQSVSGKLAISNQLLNLLGVSAILLLDSTSSSLPAAAKSIFPAPRKNVAPAAVKLHMCFDLFKGAVAWFNITEATSHDRNSFPDLLSLKGKLIIFDLWYWDYALLAQLIEVGAFFLTRVKSSASIKIVEVVSGFPKNFEGWYLFDRRLPGKPQKIVEVIGEFSQNYKPLFKTRVIGFWNPVTKCYHWYVTNLMAPAQLIYPLYRLRWQIELIFKSLKTTFRLADFSTANPNIIHTFLFAALIATTIAHPIAMILAAEFKAEKAMTPSFQRAAILLANCARQFVDFVTKKTKSSLRLLLDAITVQKRELFDPNFRKRNSTMASIFQLAETIS